MKEPELAQEIVKAVRLRCLRTFLGHGEASRGLG